MTVGEKILRLRKARGWSQEELADQVGVSRQAVSRWESDSAKPDADKVVALCDLFGISADYLLRDMASCENQCADTIRGNGTENAKPWLSWSMTAFGVLTLFVLRILASVNRTYISPVHEISSDGTVNIFRPGYYTGFGDYIEDNGLQWLVWMASISLIAGGGWLCWMKYKSWRERNLEI